MSINKDTQDYLESLVSKIEKITGLKDWSEIRKKYNLEIIRSEEAYKDMLDECEPMFMQHYYPSDVLKEVDPIAYNVGFSDFLSCQLGDGVCIELDDFMFYQHDLENLLEKLETKKAV